MAEAQLQETSPPDIASQEATSRELNKRRRQGWIGRKSTALLAAGTMAFGSPTPEPASQGDRTEEVQQRSSVAVDQAIGRQAQEQQLASKLRRKQGQALKTSAGAASKAGGAAAATRATPAGMVAGGAVSGLKSAMKGDKEAVGKQLSRGLIKICWLNLWDTFGLSIIVIDILFFIGWASSWLRKYIPAVGEEWIPEDILAKMPKSALIPLKLGEILAMSFVTFWVLMIMLIFILLCALIATIIGSVVGATIPGIR